MSSLKGGGAERVLTILANSMADFHDVEIVTFFSKESDYHISPKVKLSNLSSPPSTLKTTFISRIKKYVGRLKSTNNYFNQSKPDVIISFMDVVNITLMLSMIFGKKENRPRIILSERNVPWFNLQKHGGKFLGHIAQLMQFLLYGKADALVVQTNSLKEWAQLKWKNLYIEKIPNPIIFNQEDKKRLFKKEEKKYLLITVGRLVNYKDHKTLIKAFHLIRNQIKPNHKLCIVGDGPERESLEKMAQDLKIEDRIDFIGKTKNVNTFYKNSSILILPSWFEGVPNVVLEAMKFRIPVISSNYFGVDEIIEHDFSGLLFKINDYKELGNRILELYQNKEKREFLSSNAYKNVLYKNNVEKIANQWKQILKKVTS